MENSIRTYRSWQPRARRPASDTDTSGVLPDVQMLRHLPGCHSSSESPRGQAAPYEGSDSVQGTFSVFSLGSRGTLIKPCCYHHFIMGSQRSSDLPRSHGQ